MAVTTQEKKFPPVKPCAELLYGYVRTIDGAPIRCTRPAGHEKLHADQSNGNPVEWIGHEGVSADNLTTAVRRVLRPDDWHILSEDGYLYGPFSNKAEAVWHSQCCHDTKRRPKRIKHGNYMLGRHYIMSTKALLAGGAFTEEQLSRVEEL